MGLTAIVSSAASSASSTSGAASSASAASASTSVASFTLPVGLGIGGVFVTVAVILLLAYFDVLNAMDDADESIRTTLVASIVPLAIVFLGVVAFRTSAYL